MFIPDPDFFPSRIPDTTKKEQGKNKLVVLSVLVDNYLIFSTGTNKKDSSQLTRKYF
jgi:hypothetical protein